MQKHFAQAMERIEGLINLWSAPCAVSCNDRESFPSVGTSRVLLAVSGGIDSMCMADLFCRKYGADSIAVAHCNFHLRAEESDGDEELVRSWADEHGVLCHVTDFDTESYAAEHGISIEMAARDLRYGWFGELCNGHGYTAVAVAHNANDNAETLFLNLLRGTGLRGLCGMSLVSEHNVIRPLLQVTRKQIEGYALAHGVRYREDSTNASSEYKRNRIRNEIFPIFEKINPSFVQTLNREMGYFTEAAEIVDDYCSRAAVYRSFPVIPGSLPVLPGQTGNFSIPTATLLAHPHWRYLLYYMLEPYGFNSATLASIEELLESDRTISGKRFESPSYQLLVERRELCVRPKASEAADADVPCDRDAVMTVRAPGIYDFNGRRWRVDVSERTPDMQLKQPYGTLIADADRLKFPFVCRRWRRGDWLVPFGMKGKKKVSDMFADLKYSSVQKESAVMIVDCRGQMAQEQHVAGVLGVRMDDAYKVTHSTVSVLILTELPN